MVNEKQQMRRLLQDAEITSNRSAKLDVALVDCFSASNTKKSIGDGPCDDEFNLMQAALQIRDEAALLLQAAQDTYNDANTFYQAAYETWLNCESP